MKLRKFLFTSLTWVVVSVFLPEADDARNKNWSGPISRVLSWTTIPLGLHLRTGSSNLPACTADHGIACLFDLAPGGVFPAISVTGNAVRSYRTFSPLPALARLAVYFLWHFP